MAAGENGCGGCATGSCAQCRRGRIIAAAAAADPGLPHPRVLAAVDAVLTHPAVARDLAAALIRDNGGLAVVRRWPDPSERGIQLHSTSVGPSLTNTGALERLRQQVEDGLITLQVAQTFTPDQVVQAHRRLDAGGIRGRLVLRFDAAETKRTRPPHQGDGDIR